FLLLFLVSFPFTAICQTDSASDNKQLNILDFGVSADSQNDQTEAIQQVIDQASEGDTVFFPEGEYLIRTLLLRSGVNILSEGLIKHHSAAIDGAYSMEKQNSPNPLILGQEVKNVTISLRGESKNEGIYLLKCHQISVYNTNLTGDSTKLRAYPGILTFESSGIEIVNSKIHHFGKPRSETHSYQPGTGIRILSSNTISIRNSEIYQNGENGIFIYGSRNIEVLDNVIHHNGMSAIQVAFGDKGKEKDYNFTNNIFDSNAADAVDINNRSPEKAMDIACVIAYNISCDNGFVKGESTPDGSGIGTLINISNVLLYKNQAYRNNRPAIYVESCGVILAKDNWADNQVEVTLDLEELVLEKNRFSSINLIANTKAEKIQIKNNELGSLSFPDGIHVKEMDIENNRISNASINLNMKGKLHLTENKIENKSKKPTLLIIKADDALIENNEILSENSSAIVLRKTARNIQIVGNHIKSFNTAIFDENSTALTVKDNIITSIKGGKENQAFRSHHPNQLTLKGNEYRGIENTETVLLIGKGKASIGKEKLVSGTANYGEVEVSEIYF
ncbi:MAG: right-handed parallel beta-helix repeat-containing protein, partial [Algoriphagus sp.]